jgi:hypothetical protein
MWKRVIDVRVVSSTYQHVRVVFDSVIHIVSVCVYSSRVKDRGGADHRGFQ